MDGDVALDLGNTAGKCPAVRQKSRRVAPRMGAGPLSASNKDADGRSAKRPYAPSQR